MYNTRIHRRRFIKSTLAGTFALQFSGCSRMVTAKPNLVYVFADQWRAQDTGYAGNTQVKTPNLDKLAARSVNFSTAVSGCPVCSPYRASLMTGQYWLTHGIFHNDKPLKTEALCIAEVFKQQGYDTGYIGKWHLNGDDEPGYEKGRRSPVPKERRQGFDFWKVRECTHDYNQSFYFDENDERQAWEGYDAIAQTRMANQYIKEHADGKPFVLFLSWGPPHAPYQTAPPQYRALYKPGDIVTRENVPDDLADKARLDIAGYYAHMTALDDCMAQIMDTLHTTGLERHTILVFTSDHGDMLYSHAQTKKQQPWDESIRVPFLLRYPAVLGDRGREIDMPINTPDIMPTLLGLCKIPVPDSVEGTDYSPVIRGEREPDNEAALIECPVPFHQWGYAHGGREYRGLRTRRYTYVRDLKGPWLLFDNDADPYQVTNLVNVPAARDLQDHLDALLQTLLKERKDEFLPGPVYMRKWEYDWDGEDGKK